MTAHRARLPALLAALVMTLGLVGSFWFYRTLESSRAGTVDRHVADLVRYVRTDLAVGLEEQLQAQRRQAARLARSGLIDQAGWSADMRLYRSQYPFYRTMAVLGPDLEVRWAEGVRALGDARLPVQDHAAEIRQSARTGDVAVLEPHRLAGGRWAITLVSPIGAGDEHLGYLASEIVIAEAVRALISDRLRDELLLRMFF
ncbi:MAG: hypothetical protein V2J10_01400, partial [Wenzhouxiangella sp.]|nr:hypothetical protein [Wenzhouxiangella sp.]